MFPAYLIGALITAAFIGYASERIGFTRNGVVASIIICVGGALLFHIVARTFHISFGSPGLNAILSAIGALILIPTHYRR